MTEPGNSKKEMCVTVKHSWHKAQFFCLDNKLLGDNDVEFNTDFLK